MRPLGRALRVEDVERLCPRIAGVDDQWQRSLVGELDLRGERRALLGSWRVVVEVVEPALADGDDVGIVEVGNDRVDAVLGLVRVQPGRGEDVVVRRGHCDRLLGRGRVAPDVDHRGDPGGARRGDHVVDRHATCVVQMAVAVGVRHGRLTPPCAGTATRPWSR